MHEHYYKHVHAILFEKICDWVPLAELNVVTCFNWTKSVLPPEQIQYLIRGFEVWDIQEGKISIPTKINCIRNWKWRQRY